ncbi:MAG: GxxExxY protein [Elusimicrobiota bacterium]
MKTEKLFQKDLLYRVVSILYKVHKTLGCGFSEKVYLRALEIELKNRNIPYRAEKEISISYENKELGSFKLDLVIDEKIIIKLIVAARLPKTFLHQLTSQLNATPYEIGLLVNFGAARLDFIRASKNKAEKTLLPLRW